MSIRVEVLSTPFHFGGFHVSAVCYEPSYHFAQVPQAEIQRSSFDRSHGYKTTFDAGYLIPIFVDEVLPGDTFNLKLNAFARLATPIKPFMDNLFFDTFFFFLFPIVLFGLIGSILMVSKRTPVIALLIPFLSRRLLLVAMLFYLFKIIWGFLRRLCLVLVRSLIMRFRFVLIT